MGIQTKQVYIASDGSEHQTEQAARDRELQLELDPMIEQFLQDRGVHATSRIRGTTVADLLSHFAVHLLSPPAPSQVDPAEEPTNE